MNNSHNSKYYVPAGLPLPDEKAIERSEQLTLLIKKEIASLKSMPFSRFMELALYAPGLGYYSAANNKIGETGDFTTAPEISPIFSQCIAKQCEQVLSQLNEKNILEFGAGTGKMAADILLQLQQSNSLPDHYYILETSADLKQRQQTTIKNRAADLFDLVIWLDQTPDNSFEGIILANELLDAMPVNLFQTQNNHASELHVTLNNDQFTLIEGETENVFLKNQMSRITVNLPDKYISEINLVAIAWIQSVYDFMKKGLVVIIDYGYPEHEYYHQQRSSGTLMCHYRHHAHADPFSLIGLQDITAHVNFTAIAECADDAGFHVAGYTSQAFFLLGCGLESLAQSTQRKSENDIRHQIESSQQIQKLTLPSEMGEKFKVLALTKELDCDLLGFKQTDQRARLSPLL